MFDKMLDDRVLLTNEGFKIVSKIETAVDELLMSETTISMTKNEKQILESILKGIVAEKFSNIIISDKHE